MRGPCTMGLSDNRFRTLLRNVPEVRNWIIYRMANKPTQICVVCKRSLPIESFAWANKAYGLRQPRCRECQKTVRDKHRRKLRQEVLAAYGNCCACCGESEQAFLVVDHINGGGRQHRREIGQDGFYTWLRKEKYPNGFRLLCENCNGAIARYGVCPHIHERPRISPEAL